MNRGFHSFIFFDLKNYAISFSGKKSAAARNEFLKVINKNKKIRVWTYTTLGFKPDTRFMLWVEGVSPEIIQDFISELLHTGIGKNLKITLTLFGMVGESNYVKRPTGQEQAIGETKRRKYLIIYPFTKTAQWYLLPEEKRKKLMGEHIRVGHAHLNVRQLLLYSFGIDDQEFIVSYEVDDLADFQKLVYQMRATEVRKYTLRDTPIFTCIYNSPEKVLKVL